MNTAPASCTALECVLDVAKVPAEELQSDKTVAELEKMWNTLHDGIMERALPYRVHIPERLRATKGTCCVSGICWCQPDTRRFLTRLRDRMKSSLADSELLDSAVRGKLVVKWEQTLANQDDDGAMQTTLSLWTAMPLLYLSPWRPTLLRLAGPTEHALEQACLHFTAEVKEGMPSFHAFHPFALQSLDIDQQISVSWHALCEEAHVDHVHVGVFVAAASAATVKVWSGNKEEKKRKSVASRPLHERLSRMGSARPASERRAQEDPLEIGQGAAPSSGVPLVALGPRPEEVSAAIFDRERCAEGEDSFLPDGYACDVEPASPDEGEELQNPNVSSLLLDLSGPERLMADDIVEGEEQAASQSEASASEGSAEHADLDPGATSLPANAEARLQLAAFLCWHLQDYSKTPRSGQPLRGVPRGMPLPCQI